MAVYTAFWFGSLLMGLSIRSRAATTLFLIFVFLFIGLRLNTGFDWPVYLDMFDRFRDGFSLQKVVGVSAFFSQEPGFVTYLGLSSWLVGNYIVFQASVTVLLLWSTVSLTRSFGINRVALVVAGCLTYLMWSVGFSTLRQSMAISLFNFGLAYINRGRTSFGWSFFVMSVLFQFSSAIYIVAYLIARTLTLGRRPPTLTLFFLVALAVFSLISVALGFVIWLSPLIASKLDFYLQQEGASAIGILSLVFLLFASVSALMVSGQMSLTARVPHAYRQLQFMILILAAMSAAMAIIPVIRDRISYELFVLAVIYAVSGLPRYKHEFFAFLMVFGVAVSAISIFPSPRSLAFIPYQNALTHGLLGLPDTGQARSNLFLQLIAPQ